MSNGECKYQRHIIEYLENTLKPGMEQIFENHLKTCPVCQNELDAVKKLYSMMDKDEVVFPDEGFFRRARQKARQEILPVPSRGLSWLPKVLAPVFALLIVIAAVKFWPRPAVEISVPVADFMYDENLNALLIGRIVDDDLMGELNDLEENFAPGLSEIIDELSESEKTEFLDVLNKKYRDAIL